MDLAQIVHMIVHMGVVISIAGFLFGSILENQRVRSLLTNLWAALSARLLSPVSFKSDILEIAESVFEALYHRRGRLSLLKLIGIVIVFNGLFVYATAGSMEAQWKIASSYRGGMAIVAFTTFFLFVSCSALFYEFIAYKISKHFIERAREHSNFKYVAINLISLPVVVYGIPLVCYSIGSNAIDHDPGASLGALLLPGIFSPLLPFIGMTGIMGGNQIPLSSRLLMIPAAMSFCLPVV